MTRLDQLIGLPYQSLGRGPAFDCYGYVRHAAKTLYGLDLPDYTYGTSDDMALAAWTIFSADQTVYWDRPEAPAAGDVILIRLGRFVSHCGIFIGGDDFLHCLRGRQSAMEHFSDWQERVTGLRRYRHAAAG